MLKDSPTSVLSFASLAFPGVPNCGSEARLGLSVPCEPRQFPSLELDL